MSKLTIFVSFTLGAAIGSVATWYGVKTKYERLAQEEIDSVKRVYTYKKPVETEETQEKADDILVTKESTSEHEKDLRNKYAKILKKENYVDYTNSGMSIEDRLQSKPYVISPDEFGEKEELGYSQISLTYYADHLLADDDDELIEDVEDTIGFESLNHFGEYEDDSVFVRNDRLKVDYEILLSQRKYSEILESKPYLMEE